MQRVLSRKRTDLSVTAPGAEKGGGFPEISKLRSYQYTVVYLYRRVAVTVTSNSSHSANNRNKGKRECGNDL